MERLEELAAWLTPRTAALVTSALSRRYLLGFASEDGVLLVTGEESYFIIDARYYDAACRSVKNARVLLLRDMRAQLLELMVTHNVRSVLVEADRMTVREFAAYEEQFHYAQFDRSDALADKLGIMRMIKSAQELRCICEAQRIADRAFTRVMSSIKRGMTEKQVAAAVNYCLLDEGSEGMAFPVMAASGENSAHAHIAPTDRKLERGDFLVLDFGAVYGGYCSDMTRTLAVGTPTAEMEEVYTAVASAQNDALRAMAAGRGSKLADSVARSTLGAWGGLDRYFTHGLGHGVGLEVHEAPFISQSSRSVLRAGMVVTAEPGVYVTGRFGVRIEDMALVTEDGARVISHSTKKLLCV